MEEMFDVLNELGEFIGGIATREECHKKGLWHRAVYAFIINDNGNILLQKKGSYLRALFLTEKLKLVFTIH